jgi:hypothetical protein
VPEGRSVVGLREGHGMKRKMASRGVLLTAVLLLCAGVAYADDVLLLKDASQKRGNLASCDQTHCRLGMEQVARAYIEWIGLDRDAPAPAVRDPNRDEIHLANQSVQSVTLTGVDGGFVYTTIGGRGFSAASSLPRASVAWIHLGLPKQGGARDTPPPPPPEKGKQKGTQAKGEDKVKDQPASSDASVLWRFPPRVFIHAPARCAGCQDTLHVLELDTQYDMIVMKKSRTISTGWDLLTGSWYTYDPPVPLFPATTDVERFAFDGRFRTNVTHHFYLHHANRNLGGRPPPAAPAGGGPVHQTEQSLALGKMVQIPGVVSPEDVHVWWRDRLAQDWEQRRAARSGGKSRGASGGCEKKQFGMVSGQAEYSQTLTIENWPIIAGERASRPGPRRSSYEKLRRISVYDVNFDLRFAFGDHGGRGRDVDSECYTTDWVQHDSSGPRKPMPAGDGIPDPRPPHEEQADTSGPLDWLFGGQARGVREGIERIPNPVAAAGKAIGGVRDDLAKGPRNFADDVRHVMGGAGMLGDGTAAGPGSSGASGPPHAVTLHVRWFREKGYITEYVGDIIPHAVEGQDLHYQDIIKSATKPPGSFDMASPPVWSGANPKPPPPKSNFNWRP